MQNSYLPVNLRGKYYLRILLLLFGCHLFGLNAWAQGAFIEENGRLLIQMESFPITSRWARKTDGTAIFYESQGGSTSNPLLSGAMISVQVKINQAGIYRFEWRNRANFGTDNREHNDSWLRFPNNADVVFFAHKGGVGETTMNNDLTNNTNVLYPKGSGRETTTTTPVGASASGFFKVYANTLSWNWLANTNDFDSYRVFVKFNQPGTYTMDVSARSTFHAIDKIAMYRVATYGANISNKATLDGWAESPREGGVANQAPAVNAGADQSISLPTNATTLTGTAIDTDGSIASVAWTQVSGPSTAAFGSANALSTTVGNLVQGTYTFRFTATDNSAASGTDLVNVVVNPDPASTISVTGFTLINAATDLPVPGFDPIPNGAVINLTQTGNQLNIRANTNPSIIGSIAMIMTGSNGGSNHSRTESGAPYSLFGDSGGNYAAWSPAPQAGFAYSLTGTPYTAASGGGSAGTPLTINFSFIASANQPPVITGTPAASVNENNPYSFVPTASDPEGSPVTFSIQNQPVWASFSTVTGALTGTPNFDQAGVYSNIIISASDGSLSSSLPPFTITVNNVVRPVTANAGTDRQIRLPNSAITLTGTATGGIINTLNWSQISGPNTAVLTGADQASVNVSGLIEGSYSFVFTASNTDGAADTDTVQVTVSPFVPTDAWLEVECATVGTGLQVLESVTASNGKFLTTGIGNNDTPLSANTIAFNFSVGEAGSYSLYALVRFPTSSDDSYFVRVNGGAWVVWNGAVATGSAFAWRQVHVNSNRSSLLVLNLLEGNNTLEIAQREDGTAIDKIYVTKTGTLPTGLGESASNCITLPTNEVPVISGTPASEVLENQLYSFVPTASDADGDSLVFSVQNLPVWASFDAATGAISGVPSFDQAGTYNNIMISVTDGKAVANLPSFSILVVNVNRPVSISGTPDTLATEGQSYSFVPVISDPDGDALVFSVQNLPVWANLDVATGTISGTPGFDQAGLYDSILVSVTDGEFADSIPVFAIQVANVMQPVVADAGLDQNVFLPLDSVLLMGSASGGVIVAYAWQQLNGPSLAVLSDTTQASLTASALIEGVYEFSLTVTNTEGATAADTVQVTVLPEPPNQSPSADAGMDVEITLPLDSAVLTGSGSDADGTVASYAWAQVSGPSVAVLSDTTQTMLTVSGLLEGVYVFSLTVSDDEGATAADTVQVTVLPEPSGPVFSTNAWLEAECATRGAGWQEIMDPATSNGKFLGTGNGGNETPQAANTITFTFGVSEAGSYSMYALVRFPNTSDDSYFVRINGGNWTVWNNAIGTGSAFAWRQVHLNSSRTTPLVLNLIEGINTVEFARREDGTAIDKIYVTKTGTLPTGLGEPATNCSSEPLPNQAPVANAGNDQTITLPTNSLVLNGSGNDIDGNIAGYVWSQVSGPNTALLTNQNTQNVTVSNLIQGVYTFQLEVTDNEGAKGTDLVTVTVNPEPVALPTDFWLEAECAMVGGGLQLVADPAASNGMFVLSSVGNDDAPQTANVITFSVEVSEAGNYSLFTLVRFPTSTDDSYFVRANGGSWTVWNSAVTTGNSFAWRQVHINTNRSNFLVLNLVAGVNTIEFAKREDGAAIDKIFVTRTGSLPTGMGNPANNCGAGARQTDVISLQEANLPSAEELAIYPNPAKENLFVTFNVESDQPAKAVIYNLIGQPVSSVSLGIETQNRLYVGNLPKGMYIIQVQLPGGTWSKKFYVE